MAPRYITYQALYLVWLMTFKGIHPHTYKIITTAIGGLGCMLTSVSAFMLSTMFRNRDIKANKFLVFLCLFFLMSSLIMLLAATTLWIFVDGWSLESVGLLVVSIVFMLSPIITYFGKKIGPCQQFWSNSWLPILVAMFVHITIITTVILIMKKYEYNEEGCTSEWPLIYKLIGALASPFVLCILVFIYKNITDLIKENKQKESQYYVEESQTEHEKEATEPSYSPDTDLN